MASEKGLAIYHIFCFCLLLFLAVAVGCRPAPTLTPQPRKGPTATAAPIPSPTVPSITPASAITLTLWTTESFSPTRNDASGQLLAQQLRAFSEAHPGVSIKCVLKKPYGKGGILDFLLTTSAAVPTLLPDLVAMDTTELGEAANAELVQPLDDLISDELEEDLFPFAKKAGRCQGRLMGLPFEADIQHLLYNTARAEEPPSTWAEALSGEATYVFPAGGDMINDAFLIQYLALGGRLFDENGQPALDEGKLAEVLEFYAQGHQAGVIPPSVLGLRSLEDCWSLYLSDKADMSDVSSRRYLADRELLKDTNFATIPTRDGNVATLSHSWALAVVTEDPARQAIAAQVVEW
ncbi:MAG: extracellular solute-binding protein, partial [Chloroflexota bacterium]|nr:extracellular solute-binding protein [Chloroflexota bacterium]